MVKILARQAVERKQELRISALLGNYEYYHACGLAARRAGVTLPPGLAPMELCREMEAVLTSFEPADEGEKWLKEQLAGFEPGEEYDGTMEELLREEVNSSEN